MGSGQKVTERPRNRWQRAPSTRATPPATPRRCHQCHHLLRRRHRGQPLDHGAAHGARARAAAARMRRDPMQGRVERSSSGQHCMRADLTALAPAPNPAPQVGGLKLTYSVHTAPGADPGGNTKDNQVRHQLHGHCMGACMHAGTHARMCHGRMHVPYACTHACVRACLCRRMRADHLGSSKQQQCGAG